MQWPDRVRPLRRWVGRLEAWEIRRFGRSGLGLLGRTDVLVLETVGRRTGHRRSTPVACLRIEDGWLIAGGAGGQRSVDWVANLRARPEAAIVVGRQRVAVVAEEARGAAGTTRRDQALARWPQIRVYEARSGRTTPVFLLRPVDDR